MPTDNVVESRLGWKRVWGNLKFFSKTLSQPIVKVSIIRTECHNSLANERDYFPSFDEDKKVFPKIRISW